MKKLLLTLAIALLLTSTCFGSESEFEKLCLADFPPPPVIECAICPDIVTPDSTTGNEDEPTGWDTFVKCPVVVICDKCIPCPVVPVCDEDKEFPERFTDNGNGTVTDMWSGLIWQSGGFAPMDWQTAFNYCLALDLAGLSWRMPDTIELEPLIETRYEPETHVSIDPIFESAYGSSYWTSDRFPKKPGKEQSAMMISFTKGHKLSLILSSQAYVRCVAE